MNRIFFAANKDVVDPAVVVSFPLDDEPDVRYELKYSKII
jgi:hypothetical protein